MWVHRRSHRRDGSAQTPDGHPRRDMPDAGASRPSAKRSRYTNLVDARRTCKGVGVPNTDVGHDRRAGGRDEHVPESRVRRGCERQEVRIRGRGVREANLTTRPRLVPSTRIPSFPSCSVGSSSSRTPRRDRGLAARGSVRPQRRRAGRHSRSRIRGYSWRSGLSAGSLKAHSSWCFEWRPCTGVGPARGCASRYPGRGPRRRGRASSLR